MLLPHWSRLGGGRLASLKFALLAIYAGLRKLWRDGFSEWETPVTAVLLMLLLAEQESTRLT